MQRIDNTFNMENATYFIGSFQLDDSIKKLVHKNPHCLEYFCSPDKISNCSSCLKYLLKRKIQLFNKELFLKNLKNLSKDNSDNEKFCKDHCNSGYIYNYITEKGEINSNSDLNIICKHKTIDTFKKKNLITKYINVPYKFDYMGIFPLPKTVIHWGQLKMCCITLFFFTKVIEPTDKDITVIYAGSARGDNILLLCKMFPAINWYLIDPRPHNYIVNVKHKQKNQIQEIITGYFTDETAKYYYNKFSNRKGKLLFLSDIREGTDDDKIIRDQEQNIRWHKILKPDYSYFKFRCPYEHITAEDGSKTNKYDYYDGEIYVQAYAPMSSTESRILLRTEVKPKTYNIDEYTGKMAYFNRILRPSYYKSIIPANNYFDHCYDCTYYSKLINKYIKKYDNVDPFNITGSNKLLKTMKYITEYISKKTLDKIDIHNKYTRGNILD
jgi:hypothetical protein